MKRTILLTCHIVADPAGAGAASGGPSAEYTGFFRIPERLFPADFTQAWNMFLAQYMSNRLTGAAPQGDGRNQQQGQGSPDVRQNSPGAKTGEEDEQGDVVH